MLDTLSQVQGPPSLPKKRLQVLDFNLPETEKTLLQFIGLVNYFRDYVSPTTEMVQSLQKLIDKVQGFKEVELDRGKYRSIPLLSDCCIPLSRAILLW